MSDITIIGGGPAGSAAAIRLAGIGMKVRLYEKARFPRRKLCGGFFSPECLQDLDDLGALEQVRGAGAEPIRRIVLSAPSGARAEIALSKPGLSLSRETLDALLLRRAREAGVDVREGIDGFNHVSKEEWTVIASGRRGDAGTRGHGDMPFHPVPASPRLRVAYYGLQAFFEDVEGIGDQVELDLVPGGYVGLVRQEGRMNLCALTMQETLRKAGPGLDPVLKYWTQANPVLSRHLRRARRISSWQAVGPVCMGIRELSAPRRLFAGDAACVVDPFAGEGIAMALGSAVLIQNAFQQSGRSIEQAYAAAWHARFNAPVRIGAWVRNVLRFPALQNACVAGLQAFPPLLAWMAQHTRAAAYARS